MSDFIIGLDIDGCVYHWDRTTRYMLRRWYTDRGLEPPKELFNESTHWNMIQESVGTEAWTWLWKHGVDEGLFRYGHVVGGAIEATQELSKLGDVIAITSRPKNAVHDTLVWLSTMFDKAPLSGINILSHGQLKSEVRPLPDVYIDDATHNIDDIVDNTPDHVRAVLFDRPWNQGYREAFDRPYRTPGGADATGKRWRRAVGWDEVVGLVRNVKDGIW